MSTLVKQIKPRSNFDTSDETEELHSRHPPPVRDLTAHFPHLVGSVVFGGRAAAREQKHSGSDRKVQDAHAAHRIDKYVLHRISYVVYDKECTRFPA